MKMMNMRLSQHNDNEVVLLLFTNEPRTYSVEVGRQLTVSVHGKQHELSTPIIVQPNHQESKRSPHVFLSLKMLAFVVVNVRMQLTLIIRHLIARQEVLRHYDTTCTPK